MGISLAEFVVRWFVTAVAVFAATLVVPGINYTTFTGLALASLLLGIINALVRPILLLLCLPLILVTMGLFILVLNALLLWFVSGVLPADQFTVAGFGLPFGVVWLLASLVGSSVSFFAGATGVFIPLPITR